MATDFNWNCPHCHRDVTISYAQRASMRQHTLSIENSVGRVTLVTNFIVCPNPKCGKYTLTGTLRESAQYGQEERMGAFIDTWRLIPQSKAKVFDPAIVPQPIIDDYVEATAIVELSPKASATLSRRCLQGILRDFWGVKPGRLVDEIDEIKSKVDGTTWSAIDGIRSLGNIGAHMEKDINVIVDVDENEASLLVGLIETLIEEWYIGRAQREARMKAITTAAANKKPPKVAPPDPSPA